MLETLTPTERLAFVLHDMFDIPFAQIAPIVDRSPEAARQLASRARRRVRGAVPSEDSDLGDHQAVVEAYLAAARDGDFDALIAVLDPDVVLRVDGGSVLARASAEVRGAEDVAERALASSRLGLVARAATLNGTPGFVTIRDGRPFSLVAVTVGRGRIVELDILVDPERLARLDLTPLDEPRP